MRYVELQTPDEFENATDVEIAVWGLEPRDAVPANVFRAVTHSGGVLIGAYDGATMVGIAFAFYAQHRGKPILWSHLAGVLPAYQGQGIGEGLKMAQRVWALAHDIDEIRWTFDPLQRGNANFNLAKLGAVADTYHVNHYGTMNDAINAGMPSDRVEARWMLRERPAAPDAASVVDAPFVLLAGADQRPASADLGGHACVLAEIPRDLKQLREASPDLPLAWRLALRQALSQGFSSGYVAVSFVTLSDSNRCAYVLKRLRDAP